MARLNYNQSIVLILSYLTCFYNGLFQNVKPELPFFLLLPADCSRFPGTADKRFNHTPLVVLFHISEMDHVLPLRAGGNHQERGGIAGAQGAFHQVAGAEAGADIPEYERKARLQVVGDGADNRPGYSGLPEELCTDPAADIILPAKNKWWEYVTLRVNHCVKVP